MQPSQPPRDRPAEAKLAPGTAFGRYQIVRLIGEGGMGTVYEALHVELRKRVAIKIMKVDLARDEMARIRFVREGEAAARVRHSHVVDVSDVGNHQDMPYLVMEFLEGEELEVRLRRGGRFDIEAALDVLFPVIAAVAAGHDLGVIHRDLKPQNIFLARQANGQMTPKVLDFGVSKLLDPHGATVNLTVAGAIYGTVQYMAPEQADGSGRVDPRSDEYALAAILAETLTGQRVFPGDNLLELLRRICAGDFARPRSLRPDIPVALEEAILRAMSLDPDARFPSLYAFGQALLPFASLRARVLWDGTFSTAHAPAVDPEAPEPAPSPQSGKTLPLPPTPGGGTAVLQRTRELPPDSQPVPSGPGLTITPAPPPATATALPSGPAPMTTATAAPPAAPATLSATGTPTATVPVPAPAPTAANVSAPGPATRVWRRRPALRIAAAAAGVAAIGLALVVLLTSRSPPPDGDRPGAALPAASPNVAGPPPAAPEPQAKAPAPLPRPAAAIAAPAIEATPREAEAVVAPASDTAAVTLPEADHPTTTTTTTATRDAARARREPARPTSASTSKSPSSPPSKSASTPPHTNAKRAVLRTRNNAPVTD